MSGQSIFLSYARIDNEVAAVLNNRPGWVRFFHDFLATELKQRFKRDMQFWRDVNEIAGDAVFTPEIEAAVKRAELMVAIVSGTYLERTWTQKELREFIASRTDPDETTRMQRVLKVLKHPVPEEQMPEPLRNRGRDFAFFEIEPHTNIERQFFLAGQLRPQYEQRYLDLIENITHHIMERIGTAVAAAPVATGPTVFVAVPPASSSMVEVYLSLVSELRRENCEILPRPGEPVPDTLQAADAMLKEALPKAALAVHLIGESSGKTCDGATEPLVPLQLRRSFEEMQRRPELRRLIWLPKEVAAPAGPHADFLARLRQFNSAALPLVAVRDDVVAESFDAFLAQVRRTLAPAKNEPQPASAGQKLKTLYVLAADADITAARRELRAAVREATAAAVNMPLAADKAAETRASHEAAHLRDAEAAIILWGSEDVAWVEAQLLRLRHWPTLGRSQPFRAIVLLIIAPDSDEKDEEDPLAPGEVCLDARPNLQAALAALAALLGP